MTNLHDGRKLPVIVLHAEVGDYGLDPYQMRVYIRIVRRAGRGECFETVANMAKGCEMSTGSVKKAIKFLIDHRFITRHESGAKEGKASRYRLTDPELWIHAKEGGGHHTTQVVTDPGGGHHTTQGVATTDPGGGHVVATEEDPFKKIPLSSFPLNEFSEPESKNEPASPSEPPPEKIASSLDGGQEVFAAQQESGSEAKKSAASLAQILAQVAELDLDHVPPAMRREWRMKGLLPWRETDGRVSLDFALFVGKQLSFKGQQETMHPAVKGERHIEGLEKGVDGIRSLVRYWELWQEKKPPAHLTAVPAAPAPSQPDEYRYNPEAIARAKAIWRGGVA